IICIAFRHLHDEPGHPYHELLSSAEQCHCGRFPTGTYYPFRNQILQRVWGMRSDQHLPDCFSKIQSLIDLCCPKALEGTPDRSLSGEIVLRLLSVQWPLESQKAAAHLLDHAGPFTRSLIPEQQAFLQLRGFRAQLPALWQTYEYKQG